VRVAAEQFERVRDRQLRVGVARIAWVELFRQRPLAALDGAGVAGAKAPRVGGNRAWLRALKRRYDPNNVLRRNQNIPPGPD
jgi:FAD/FMN-containing dehydrogenase